MNEGGPVDATTREIARGLVEVVESAIHPGAPVLSASAAREVARLLELEGLERVLAQVETFGSRRPRPLAHVLERTQRLLAAARARESVAPFVEADAELRALADTLADTQWSEADEAASAPPVASITLADALPGWVLHGTEAGPSPLVGAPVASALRAALDWLAADPAAPLQLETHDDFVALHFDVHQGEGLAATGEVLETVGGHLAPLRPGARRWRLVVPRLVARPAFLLLEQGHMGLAVPWSSVVRLRMVSPERAAEDAPVLAPLRWSAPPAGERPAALLAHGLRRAWLFADRVVWRFAAHAEEVEESAPVSGLVRAVRGEDGTLFWLAEAAWLLRATEAPTAAIEEAVVPEAVVPEPTLDTASADAADAAEVSEGFRDDAPDAEAEIVAPTEFAAPLEAEIEPLDFATAPVPPEPADWIEESDDAPVEWLVHSNAGPIVTAAPPPELTLLGPEDVEPLEGPAPVVAPGPVRPEPAVADAVPTPPADLLAVESDPTPRSSRIARALARLEATLEATLPLEGADERAATVGETTTPADAEPAIHATEPHGETEAPIVVETPNAVDGDTLAPAASDAPAPLPATEEARAETGEPPASAVEEAVPTAAADAPHEAITAGNAASEPTAAPPGPMTAAIAAPLAAPPTLEITSRLALVAEDSLVASIFLQRLLEQRGFRAVAVEMALDLTREIERGTWGLVFADVHLPDARGGAHLEAVVRAASRAPGGVAVVALTRDAEDEATATAAGITRHLRKPFEAARVDRLFTALGLPVRADRA